MNVAQQVVVWWVGADLLVRLCGSRVCAVAVLLRERARLSGRETRRRGATTSERASKRGEATKHTPSCPDSEPLSFARSLSELRRPNDGTDDVTDVVCC